MIYKTGLLRGPPPELHFRSYLLEHRLPPVPAVFGHQALFPQNDWKLLANDRIGDCTIASSMHCSMLFNKIVGKTVRFTDLDAVDDYSAVSGYVPGDVNTDAGANMIQVCSYWQKTGMRDARNNRHKIVGYLAVDYSRLDRVFTAAYLFDAVKLGVQIPNSAEKQFVAGRPWSNVAGDEIIGYHDVPLIGRLANGNAVVVTWGASQEVEQSWLEQNLNEVVAIVSTESLTNGKSAEGFDLAALQDDLEMIAG